MIVAETAVAGERPVLGLLILDLLHQLLDLHHLLRELRRRNRRYALRLGLRERAGTQQRDQRAARPQPVRPKDEAHAGARGSFPQRLAKVPDRWVQPAGARPDRHWCCSSLPLWVAAHQAKTSSSTGRRNRSGRSARARHACAQGRAAARRSKAAHRHHASQSSRVRSFRSNTRSRKTGSQTSGSSPTSARTAIADQHVFAIAREHRDSHRPAAQVKLTQTRTGCPA